MDLNLTTSELEFRDGLRAWLGANLNPGWRDELSKCDGQREHFDYLLAWQRRVYEGGWAGISWPKEYGGRGASLMDQVIFTEEMARAGAPTMPGILGLALVGPTLGPACLIDPVLKDQFVGGSTGTRAAVAG